MTTVLLNYLCKIQPKYTFRAFGCGPVLTTKQWRMDQGFSEQRNSEGILTDGPDYTYLDGRPTPLLHKQKQRILRHQQYANKIVTLCSELDNAKLRHQNMAREKEEERQRILNDRLKPKGSAVGKGKKILEW